MPNNNALFPTVYLHAGPLKLSVRAFCIGLCANRYKCSASVFVEPHGATEFQKWEYDPRINPHDLVFDLFLEQLEYSIKHKDKSLFRALKSTLTEYYAL